MRAGQVGGWAKRGRRLQECRGGRLLAAGCWRQGDLLGPYAGPSPDVGEDGSMGSWSLVVLLLAARAGT